VHGCTVSNESCLLQGLGRFTGLYSVKIG